MGNLRRRRKKERNLGRRVAEEAWKAAEGSRLDKAEKLIRQALKGREGDCVLWNDLGLILWREDRLREAEKSFRNALIVRPDYEEAKMNLSSLLASRGFYRQALRLEEELASSKSERRGFHEKKAAEYRQEIARLESEEDAGE